MTFGRQQWHGCAPEGSASDSGSSKQQRVMRADTAFPISASGSRTRLVKIVWPSAGLGGKI
jgi:hypothetical protein